MNQPQNATSSAPATSDTVEPAQLVTKVTARERYDRARSALRVYAAPSVPPQEVYAEFFASKAALGGFVRS